MATKKRKTHKLPEPKTVRLVVERYGHLDICNNEEYGVCQEGAAWPERFVQVNLVDALFGCPLCRKDSQATIEVTVKWVESKAER